MSRRLVAFSAITFVITAILSYGFFHPDEHEQILELVGFKLGITPHAILPWEHAAEVRPWFQPAIYLAIAKVCAALGVKSPFTLALVFRLFSSAISWLALMRLTQLGETWLSQKDEQRVLWRVTCTLGFLPYLAARTSSENLSASCVVLGFVLTLRDIPTAARMPRDVSAKALRSFLLAGMLLGAGFECRYQSAFLSAGLIFWLIVIARAPLQFLAACLLGIAALVGVGTLADAWGYGHFVVVPYRYFTVNLVQGVAKTFGSEPIYAYLYLLVCNVFLPIVVVAIVGMVLSWVRNPKHALTWTTVPFVLVHCIISHKEERFFFPLAPFVPLMLVMAFAPVGTNASAKKPTPKWILWCWSLRTSIAGKLLIAWNMAALILLAIYPLNWNGDTDFYKFADGHINHDAVILTTLDNAFENHPFYRPGGFTAERINPGEFTGAAQRAPDKVYFVWRAPHIANDGLTLPPGISQENMVFSQFPGWQYPSIRSHIMLPFQAWVGGLRTRHSWLPRYSWLELYEVPKASLSTEPSKATIPR